MKHWIHKLLEPKTVLLVYSLVIVVSSILDWSQPGEMKGEFYNTHYNNYVIFKQSFQHFFSEKDLYIAHPTEHWDLYKYSPAFAIFMGIFFFLPDVVGLSLWNLLNGLLLIYGIFKLPIFDTKTKSIICYLIFFDLVTANQNSQSNALVAALAIWLFNAMFHEKSITSAYSVAANFLIKVYGLAFGFLLLFSKKPLRPIVFSGLAVIIGLALPFAFKSSEYVISVYDSWINMMLNDQDESVGKSVAGILDSWFGLSMNKTIMLVGSFLVYPLLLLKRSYFFEPKNLALLLASMLIWIVIFNHKAESNTYVIAMVGVSIWFFLQEKLHAWQWIVLGSCLLLVSLSPTDLFPRFINKNYVQPYSLKALPCTVVWLISLYQLYKNAFTSQQLTTTR